MHLCVVFDVIWTAAFQPKLAALLTGCAWLSRSEDVSARQTRVPGWAKRLAAALALVALAASARAQTTVTLAWDPSAGVGISGYRVYQGSVSRTYTNIITVGNTTNCTVSNLVAGATYFFAVTARGTNGLESDFSTEISYTVPVVATALTFAADCGTITAPFAATNGTLCQSVGTTLTNGGRAVYCFTIAKPGNYLVSAMVKAPNEGANSLYVNIDAEPTDPLMIWDIPVCTSLASRTVSWRGNGNGDPASSQYLPKTFTLAAGAHQLIIRGREASTTLGTITIAAVPPRLGIREVTTTSGTDDGGSSSNSTAIVLRATGQPGQVYGVFASPDLKAWTMIGTLTLNASGSGQFTDPAGTSLPSRMYRLQAISLPKLQIQPPVGGAVVLSGTGQSGQAYSVLGSEDLKTWAVIGTVTANATGSFMFTAPAGSIGSKGFYRLQLQ